MLTNHAPLRALAAAVIALTATISPACWAAAVTWKLQDVVFDDGGTASGSFVFDAGSASVLD